MPLADFLRRRPLQAMVALASLAGMLLALRSGQRRRRRADALARGERRRLHGEWRMVDGLCMHARVARHDGAPSPVLVFVHGWGVSGSYFLPTAERLAAGHEVHVPDLPGHGRSASPAQPLDVVGLSDALIRWMDCSGIARAVLVGQSMGSAVAVETAVRRPDLVERLVLIGPTPDPQARGVLRPLARLLMSAPFEHWSLAAVIVRDYLRMGRRLWPEFFAMQSYPIERRMAALTVDTLLVSGARDALVPRRWLAHAAHLADAGAPVLIAHWGHAVQYSAPEQVAEVLRRFVTAPGAAAAARAGRQVRPRPARVADAGRA